MSIMDIGIVITELEVTFMYVSGCRVGSESVEIHPNSHFRSGRTAD